MNGNVEIATTVQAGAGIFKYPNGQMGWIHNWLTCTLTSISKTEKQQKEEKKEKKIKQNGEKIDSSQ